MKAFYLLACTALLLSSAQGQLDPDEYDNCELFGENRLKVAWTVDEGAATVNFLLCGCQLDEIISEGGSINQYLAFGLSGSATETQMVGADAVVVWVDDQDGPQAVDYYLSSQIQCRGGSGACPDTRYSSNGTCTDDIVPGSVSGSKNRGEQCVAFSRKFSTGDNTCDLNIVPGRSQYIVWGIGGLEETAFKHFTRAEPSDPPIQLGRSPVSNQCSDGLVCPRCGGFEEIVMDLTGGGATVVAKIGPTASERGYTSIAGQAGWGIAWYLNDTLIPRLVVQRHHTYTFVSQGGNDPSISARYHPFYITDDKSGGRFLNSDSQRQRETVFAGIDENETPLGIGPYCRIVEGPGADTAYRECGTFQEYLAGLMEQPPCQNDVEPGRFTWTPDDKTPNTVYYQCATHRNVGYKITVEPPITTPATTESAATTKYVYTVASFATTMLIVAIGILDFC